MNSPIFLGVFLSLLSPLAAADIALSRPEMPTTATPEILGGKPAIPGSWPATFVFVSSSNNRCTATAIGPRVLLTAGHCVSPSEKGNIQETGITLVCEKHSFGDAVDLALCQSSREIPLNKGDYYETLDLNPGAPPLGSALALLGFGCSEKSKASTGLYEGIAIVSIAPTPETLTFETKGGASICSGDSGGAAYLPGALNGSRTIVGVASKMAGKEGSNFASITSEYARRFIDEWLDNTIDPSTGKKKKERICGLDKTLHSCNN